MAPENSSTKPAAWRLSLSGFRLSGRPGAEELRQLAGVIADLERMNHSTEADFLKVSEKLGGFLSVARSVSSEIAGITQAIAGEQGQTDGRALTAVLDHAREMEKRANAATGLSQLRVPANRIRRGISGFEQAVPSFRVIAIMSQMETARLGGAGLDFGHLADEIRALSDSIRSRVDLVLAGSKSMEERIESALRDAAEFDAGALKALPALIASVETGLNEFEVRQNQSAATAANLGRQFDLLSKAIGDVVTSIQSHDITRQQVEHVIQSLRQPAGGLPTVAVVDLQLAQLDNASRSFSAAIQQMDRRLETIASQVRAMAAESRELLGDANGLEDPFFVQMENCFKTIAGAVSGCDELEAGTQAAVVALQNTVESVQASMDEIHTVEIQLKRLALNAGISAAHIGAAGQPLEIVAASMQRLQEACQTSSDEVEQAIQSLRGSIQSILDAGQARFERAGPDDGVIVRLRNEIDELHAGHERAVAQCAGITDQASVLCEDIQALREGFSSGTVFAAAMERSCRSLRAIRPAAVREHGSRGGNQLQNLEQLYTMHAERQVHQKMTGTPAETQAGSDLGDNVELF